MSARTDGLGRATMPPRALRFAQSHIFATGLPQMLIQNAVRSAARGQRAFLSTCVSFADFGEPTSVLKYDLRLALSCLLSLSILTNMIQGRLCFPCITWSGRSGHQDGCIAYFYGRYFCGTSISGWLDYYECFVTLNYSTGSL